MRLTVADRRVRATAWFLASMSLMSAAFVVAVFPAPEARAAQKVTVAPHLGLADLQGDGQFVSVAWSGFPKRQPVYARECVRGATDPANQCSVGGLFSVCGLSCPGVGYIGQSDPDGEGTGSAQVAIGRLNTEEDGSEIPGRTFTCDYRHACSLFVVTDPTDLGSGDEIKLGFAAPTDACPETSNFLSGSGGSAGNKMFLSWGPDLCKEKHDLGTQYVLRSASFAVDDYIAGVGSDDDARSAFAVTNRPLTNKQVSTLQGAGGSAGFAPMTASAMTFVYKIYDPIRGQRITDLVLTPELLARMITGQLRTWGDPQIAKLNPHHKFPQLVGVVGRGDACEETLTMTRFLWAHARKELIEGGEASGIKPNPFATGPTDLLPSLGQINLVTGARAEASGVATGTAGFDSISTYGVIGYMDSTWAAQYNLPTVRIKFPNGAISAATPRTINRAIASMNRDDQGLLQPDVGIMDREVWPMPTISYAVVPYDSAESSSPPTYKEARALADMIRFGVGYGQTDPPAGYVPLPGSLQEEARVIANSIIHAKEPEVVDPPDGDPGPSGPGSPADPGGPTGSTGPIDQSPSPPTGGDGPSAAPPIAFEPVVAQLAATSYGKALPWTILAGLAAAVVGMWMLYGPRVRSVLAPVGHRIRHPFGGGKPKGS